MRRWVSHFLDEAFNVPDRIALRGGAVCQFNLLGRIFDGEKCAGMAHRETPLREKELDVHWKFQQPEKIGHRRAVLAGAPPDLLMVQVQLANQAIESLGGFDRIQILALNVFNKRDLEEAVVGEILQNSRNDFQTGGFRRAKPPLTGNQLVARSFPANDKWLNDAIGAYRGSKLFDSIRIENGSGLQRIRINLRHGKGHHEGRRG